MLVNDLGPLKKLYKDFLVDGMSCCQRLCITVASNHRRLHHRCIMAETTLEQEYRTPGITIVRRDQTSWHGHSQ